MKAITAAPKRLAICPPKHDLILSPVIAALDQAWAMMRERVPELGAAVIVVKRDSNAWGHYTLDRPWGRPYGGEMLPEIMISGENLARGAKAVFGTLAHEATHYLQHVDGVKGVDSNGRHNMKFAAGAAFYFGLDVTKVVEHHGFSNTEVPDAAVEIWKDVIDVIDAGIAVAAGRPHVAGLPGVGISVGGGSGIRGGRNKNNDKYTCQCGHIMRMSRKAYVASQPYCSVCVSNFE